MKKIFLLILTVSVLLPSCVSQKKYASLEAVNQQSKDSSLPKFYFNTSKKLY